MKSTLSWSAPCCARNAATPALITGDDQALINMGYSLASVAADSDNEGQVLFTPPDSRDLSNVLRMDASFLLSDRIQFGIGTSFVNHYVQKSEYYHSTYSLGDTRVSLGYEILPMWTYSKWRPQAFSFVTLSFPTGRSKYEAKSPLLADITGNGFYAVSFGTIFLKRWGLWDFFLMPEVHHGFPRTFEAQLVKPGWGGSVGLGGGFNPAGVDLRLGMRITPRLDQATQTWLGDQLSQVSRPISVCDTGFDMGYLINANNSLMVSYTDQTLLGNAMNANLNRTFAVNFQHRWER